MYNEILREFSSGLIDARTARDRIGRLAARDDEGVIWTIDPGTGAWMRTTRFGERVFDTPPVYGYPAVTPHKASANPLVPDPDDRITFYPVLDERVYSRSLLRGATRPRVPDAGRGAAASGPWASVVRWVPAAGMAVAALLLAYRLL